jgi:hypothetical protein
MVTAGPERWGLAIRDDAVAGRVVWRICADGASYAGDAGMLLRSILSAAGFTLLRRALGRHVPPAGFALTIAFGMRAFQAACAIRARSSTASAGQVIDTSLRQSCWEPTRRPILLPNNVPLKKWCGRM